MTDFDLKTLTAADIREWQKRRNHQNDLEQFIWADLHSYFNIALLAYVLTVKGYDSVVVDESIAPHKKENFDKVVSIYEKMPQPATADFIEKVYNQYGERYLTFIMLDDERINEFIAIYREFGEQRLKLYKDIEEADKGAAHLLKVEKATTKTAQIPQSKIINYLFNDGYTATQGKHELEVSKDGAIAVKLELNEFLDINRLNGYDRAVYNAICNLWDKNGTHILTSEQILNFLSGNTLRYASEKSKEDVFKSIQKLMATVITYDATGQIKMIAKSKHQNISDFKAAKGVGNLIKVDGAQVITKQGNIVDAYKIIGQPLLFYYSKEIGQIATYPVELNDVKDLALTTKNVALKDTILRLICIIKNENNNYNGNKIYLTGEKGIYNTLEPGKVYSKAEKKRIRDDIEKILKNCVEQAFIKKYEFIKVSEGGGTASKGREYNAIEIFI